MTISIDDLRRSLRIKLTVAPSFWLKALWSPSERRKDAYRDQLIAHLTGDWDRYEVTAPTPPSGHDWDQMSLL